MTGKEIAEKDRDIEVGGLMVMRRIVRVDALHE